jgi:hypothetical protein
VTTIELNCPVGKWRFNRREFADYHINSVGLKGMRGRVTPLKAVDRNIFSQYRPFDKDGNPSDSAFCVSSVPTMYYTVGTQLYLWPTPMHQWTMVLEIRKKRDDRVRPSPDPLDDPEVANG